MITDSFDDKSKPIITPEMVYGINEKICDICIITFSDAVIKNVLNSFNCAKVAEIKSVNGGFPIYTLDYKGKKIAFYMTMIGAACSGILVEEVNCLVGAKKFIMFGSCGSLCRDITAGKVIIPTAAYRDEGVSYHYMPPSDYIEVKNANIVEKFFNEMQIPYVTGKTWTTDAIFRETKLNMEKRKAEGCIAVEMECAAVQAVCNYKGFEFYNFLLSGDLLDCEEWDKRILGQDSEKDYQLKSFLIALELALAL